MWKKLKMHSKALSFVLQKEEEEEVIKELIEAINKD